MWLQWVCWGKGVGNGMDGKEKEVKMGPDRECDCSNIAWASLLLSQSTVEYFLNAVLKACSILCSATPESSPPIPTPKQLNIGLVFAKLTGMGRQIINSRSSLDVTPNIFFFEIVVHLFLLSPLEISVPYLGTYYYRLQEVGCKLLSFYFAFF